jgi:hypothetical protein
MDLQLGKVGLSGSARRHCFPSPAINPVAELQLAAITNWRSHRHQIPESLSESRKSPTRFAEDPKKRGPAPTGKGVPVVVRLQPPDLSALDEGIKGQDIDVSRPEAVRRLLAQALQKKR